MLDTGAVRSAYRAGPGAISKHNPDIQAKVPKPRARDHLARDKTAFGNHIGPLLLGGSAIAPLSCLSLHRAGVLVRVPTALLCNDGGHMGCRGTR